MKKAVIDSSVVLKWYLMDENDGKAALSLLSRYVSDDLKIIAPSLLEYEVINGLFISHKRGRIPEQSAATAIEGFISLEIEMKNVSDFYKGVLKYCKEYGCTAYDGSYLAVAADENIPFITADNRLYNAVKKGFKLVKWISEM